MIQRMTFVAIALAILIWLSPQFSVASDFQNEIFVKFRGDVVHVASTGTSVAVDSGTIESPEVLAILNRHQAQTIVKTGTLPGFGDSYLTVRRYRNPTGLAFSRLPSLTQLRPQPRYRT
ncbi:MAG: hypothetical protein NT028_10200 [candidate division Zixibacteria bacterium]|nr:hypothetical protein [candidate division Zixibacteria bacterium]